MTGKKDIGEFMRKNINDISQVRGRWLINKPKDRLRQNIFKKYWQFKFGSYDKYKKYRGSVGNQTKTVNAFNTSIYGWLQKNYPFYKHAWFTHTDEVIIKPSSFVGLPLQTDVPRKCKCKDG